jgi:hypothetical protein
MFLHIPHSRNPWDAKRAAREHNPSRENCVSRLFDAMRATGPGIRAYLVQLFKGFPMVRMSTCECNAVTLCGLFHHLFTTCSLVQCGLHVQRPARRFWKQQPLLQVHLLGQQCVGDAHDRYAHQTRDIRVGRFQTRWKIMYFHLFFTIFSCLRGLHLVQRPQTAWKQSLIFFGSLFKT